MACRIEILQLNAKVDLISDKRRAVATNETKIKRRGIGQQQAVSKGRKWRTHQHL